MAQRGGGCFSFRVRETQVVNPERVAQGLNVWADYLARRVPSALPTPSSDEAPAQIDGG